MESKTPQAPSHAPDFSQHLHEAQRSGDFEFVIETAKQSHRMLMDFRDVIKASNYAGKDAHCIAMGLNFMENMISNSAQQIQHLKETEKQTREAVKAAMKAQKEIEPLSVIDPEKPAPVYPEPSDDKMPETLDNPLPGETGAV